MTDKIHLYDLFGALVPGALLTAAVAVLFPSVWGSLNFPAFPEAFSVIALSAAALFVGQITQSVGSLIEPALFRTWGGRPSDRALADGLGDRYFPKDTASRIRAKLERVVGPGASGRSLFLYSMTLAESDEASRAGAFNGSYAYHRALLTSVLLLLGFVIAAAGFGHADLSRKGWFLVAASFLALISLLWHRTKQRAYYYVREVLLTAERILDAAKPAPASPS